MQNQHRINRRRPHRPSIGQRHRLYYWIVSRDDQNGKPYLIFGGMSEQEARARAFEVNLSNFEIKALRTRDQAKASAMLRGSRLESTKNLHEAARRIGHERTVKRDMLRKRRGLR